MSNGRNGPHLTLGSTPPPLTKGKLRLYSMRFCPYAQRIHLILDAKKIPHDIVNINLTDKPEWYIQKCPHKKVPALELENGTVIYESLIVADYLDSFPGRQLSSSDPLQRAQDKILVEHFNKVIGAYFKVYTDIKNFKPQDVLEALDLFEEELAKRGTPFFAGSLAGMPDYMIWPWCERADMLPFIVGDNFRFQKDRFPKLMEWKRAMLGDEAVKASFLDPQIHANFLKTREATGKSNYDMLVVA